MKIISTILLMLALSGSAFSQDVKVVSFDQLMNVLHENNGKMKVVNFWATWCKPCVDELPYFVKATETMKDQNFEFVFVSVDFQSVHENVVEKAKQLGLNGTVLQLDVSGNDWIDEVDSNWSGAIPYTLMIFPNGKKINHYDQFENYDDLKSFLDTTIPN